MNITFSLMAFNHEKLGGAKQNGISEN